MKFRLFTLVVIVPAIAAAAVATGLYYYRLNHEVVHVQLDFDVDLEHDDKISQWRDRWSDHLVNYELVGGCGCCVATYDVQGPRQAINSFPPNETLVVKWLSD